MKGPELLVDYGLSSALGDRPVPPCEQEKRVRFVRLKPRLSVSVEPTWKPFIGIGALIVWIGKVLGVGFTDVTNALSNPDATTPTTLIKYSNV